MYALQPVTPEKESPLPTQSFQYRKRYVRVATAIIHLRRVLREEIERFNTASGMYALQQNLEEFAECLDMLLFQYRKRYVRVATWRQ